MSNLRRIRFYRHFEKDRPSPARWVVFPFIDEYGKITNAKYKLIEYQDNRFLYRLDGRSLRYMRRRNIIENRLPFILKVGDTPIKSGKEEEKENEEANL